MVGTSQMKELHKQRIILFQKLRLKTNDLLAIEEELQQALGKPPSRGPAKILSWKKTSLESIVPTSSDICS